MSERFFYMIGLTVGSTLGAYLPTIFGVSMFSYSSIFFSMVGGLAGIWVIYKILHG
jgi:hypothetical protein